MLQNESTTKREQKHMIINSSIDRMSDQIASLEELVSRIGGRSMDKPIQSKSDAPPCLLEFLNGASDELNLLSDRLVKVYEELDSMLF